MNKLATMACAAALIAPAGAFAQGAPTFDGSLTLSFGTGDIAGVDYSTTGISFASDIIFNPNWQIAFDLDMVTHDLDTAALIGTDLSLELTRFAVEPQYNFGNGFYAGIYYQNGEIDISAAAIPALHIGVDLDSYGVFGGYDTGAWGVELYIGESDTNPSVSSFGVDISDYGLIGYYDVSPNLSLFGSYHMTDISVGANSIDIDLLALGAEYDMMNGFSIYGSVGQLGLDISGVSISPDVTQYALGVAYDLGAAGAGVPATISFEVAHTEIDIPTLFSDTGTTYTLGLTIPLGGGSSTPLNSSARVAGGDIRTALASGLLSF